LCGGGKVESLFGAVHRDGDADEGGHRRW
jgi:hypothetical protein